MVKAWLLSLVIILSSHFAYSKMRVGVYLGTFDPPHVAHEEVTVNAVNTLGLDLIYVMAMPDNKEKPNATPFKIRQSMVEAHFEGLASFQTVDEEMLNAFAEGYVDGLIDLIKRRHEDAEVFHVIGSDAVSKFPFTQEANHDKGVGTILNVRDVADVIVIIDKVFDGETSDILTTPYFHYLPQPTIKVSSTEIRESYQRGKNHWAVKEEVFDIAAQKELYGILDCNLQLSDEDKKE